MPKQFGDLRIGHTFRKGVSGEDLSEAGGDTMLHAHLYAQTPKLGIGGSLWDALLVVLPAFSPAWSYFQAREAPPIR
jgi:hypothetical protein